VKQGPPAPTPVLLAPLVQSGGTGPLLADTSGAVDVDEDCEDDCDVDIDVADVVSEDELPLPPCPPAPSSGSATTLPPHAAARERASAVRRAKDFIVAA
jgi:hypothetical protein